MTPDVISLRELAAIAGFDDPRRLLRQLEALERDPALHSVGVLVRARGKIFVKRHILKLMFDYLRFNKVA